MGAVNDQPTVNGGLAGLFGIEGGHRWIDVQSGNAASAVRYNTGAGRGRINIHGTGRGEGLHKLAHARLVG